MRRTRLQLQGEDLGGRMRAALARAGLSQAEAGRRMGELLPGGKPLHAQVISKWLTGIRRPSADYLRTFAQVVGVSVEELYGTPQPDPKVRFAEMMLSTADALMRGDPLPGALDQATGSPQMFTAEERALLAEASARWRQVIMNFAGRAWDSLTDEEKLSVFEQVVEYARRRAGGEEGRRGGASKPTPPVVQ